MDMVTERRSSGGARVPLNGIVRLAEADDAVSFEADGIDVGLGGASMRSAYVPDVGSRLFWEFGDPTTGTRLEADAEVVWAQDGGGPLGEFGLRFVSFAPGGDLVLRELVSTMRREQAAERLSAEAHVAVGSVDKDPIERVRTRLRLASVATPIVAEVVSDAPDLLTVKQELPFLRVGTEVELGTGGRPGRLAALDLTIEDDTPFLVLMVERPSLEEERAPAAGELPPDAGLGSPEPERDTLPGLIPAECEDPLADEWPATEGSARAEAPTRLEPGSWRTRARGPAAAALVRVLAVAEAALLAARPRVLRAVGHLRARLEARLPALARLLREGSLRALAALTALGRTLSGFARILGERSRARLAGQARVLPRRTTAPPPSRTNIDGLRRTRADADPSPAPNRRYGLWAVGGLAALGLVLAAVSVLGPSDDLERATLARAADGLEPAAPSLAPAPPAVAPAASPPAAALPAPAPTLPPVPVPVVGGPSAPALLAPPGAALTQSVAPPPSVVVSAVRPAAPGTLAGGSAYSVDVRPIEISGEDPTRAVPAQPPAPAAAQSFGTAAIPNGVTFVLRMSQPVRGLTGETYDDGFSVTIPGSLALERAAPISASHPKVRRSMIVNYGDHSVLTLRFAPGTRPAYRVRGQGAALEITIAR